jgi:cytochrome P450
MGGQATPPADDKVLRFEELPVAESRTAAYKIVRDAGPVARDDHGAYVITTSEAAEFVLRQPGLFSSKRAFDGVGSPVPMVPIGTDPPEHTRYRRVLQPMFSPRSTAPWQPKIRALAGELIDNVIGKGECDVVADLAVPLPAQVFLTLFGLPPEDRDRLLSWKDAILDTVGIRGAEGPSEESARLGAELYGYLVGHIAERRQRGGTDDMLGQLLADTTDDALDDEEMLGLSFQFVLAGLDTVTCAMSTAFATLASQPGLRRQIAADPSLIPSAIEELLRVDGPVATLPRVVTEDVEVAGQTIPAGNYVQVAVAVANRDPAEHPDPDTIDFGRQERHLAFGGGPHGCLGSHLARLEMRVALEEWHRRIPEYELAPGTTPRATWPAGLVGIDSLPLVFPAGGGGDPTDSPASGGGVR